jgi:hypothetical protein
MKEASFISTLVEVHDMLTAEPTIGDVNLLSDICISDTCHIILLLLCYYWYHVKVTPVAADDSAKH